MDKRLTPANARVAALSLQGKVDAETFTAGERRQIGMSIANLWATPERQKRERQLLYGEHVTVFEELNGVAFVQAARDGYVGYVDAITLTDAADMTHRVAVPATHLYRRPDMKQIEHSWLSFGARVRIVSADGAFFETDQGLFIPKPHVRPINAPFADTVTVAQMHFGVPYLWGGNSAQGIDCSGLVQASLLAGNIPCPGDSDLQEKALGSPLEPGTPAERGDLFFWKGHVALAVDGDTLIHANAYHMAVAYEPIAGAVARIEEQGGGPVTAHKRL
ncbi:C40 family peptidase [Actibacterium lipolyticum]|uniref:Gamma-D-glutamyl-L-lysine endopeptidase n=1 Tax=Actibacterium lipolyticum TaxID=1524263 RepID=A0A238JL50_9RHOB|nr:Gamma-D-glutamyl-L-lysine endopeptidase [Actibacterium lipolyticum]